MERPTPLSAHRLAVIIDSWDTGSGPAYRRLADRIRAAVMDGRIPTGTRLPSERTLAEATGLSRTTTARAYETLRETGLARTRHGSGTVVEVPLGAAGSTSMLGRPAGEDGLHPMLYYQQHVNIYSTKLFYHNNAFGMHL